MAGFLSVSPAYLTFQTYAFQRNGQGTHNQRQFNVLCGDNRPQITDGYATWNVIARPLRQGITVPTGFNPAQLKVDMRFGIWDGRFGVRGWDTTAQAAEEVESNIDDLHWMAGGNGVAGPSPIVYVDSYRATKGGLVRTHLVPKQYWGVGWVINGGVTWGNSLSHKNGSRIYQEASVNLLGYSPAQGASPPPRQQTKLTGGFFKTNPQTHTALAIAAAPSSRAPQALVESLAQEICQDPRNNPCKGHKTIKLERRSITWNIPLGIDVWVPGHPI